MMNCDLLFALAPPLSLSLSVSLIRIFDWSLSFSLFFFVSDSVILFDIMISVDEDGHLAAGHITPLLVRTIPVIIN